MLAHLWKMAPPLAVTGVKDKIAEAFGNGQPSRNAPPANCGWNEVSIGSGTPNVWVVFYGFQDKKTGEPLSEGEQYLNEDMTYEGLYFMGTHVNDSTYTAIYKDTQQTYTEHLKVDVTCEGHLF